MSHSIIFDTKFINLSDGRLLHLDRSGCNNDDAGRDLSDYIGKIYTQKELMDYAKSFMKDKELDGWELKILGRHCTYYEYGEHLLRMAKRAVDYNTFCSERYFSATRYDGVNLIKPEEKIMTPKEFSDCFYKLLYGGQQLSYTRITTPLNNEKEIIQALDKKESVSFYVGKKYKVRKYA